ncbi:MAG: glycine cleavage system protein GcvH [Bacteroidaceae bacterium]|nr:glycine cleavage system protein GcvH [Bacteroidaceae bacterium]
MAKVIEGLFYSESHEWVKIEDGIATVGISDFAQKELGDVVYVDMPEIGATVTKGSEFGAVESVKAASDLYSPVSGTVLQVNQDLTDSPELLNQDPYTNWIIRLENVDNADLAGLMDAATYQNKFN